MEGRFFSKAFHTGRLHIGRNVDKVTAVIIKQSHTAAKAIIIAIVQICGIGHIVQDHKLFVAAARPGTDGHKSRAQMVAFGADQPQEAEDPRVVGIRPRFGKIVLADNNDRVVGGVVIIRRVFIETQVIFRRTDNKILPVKKTEY